MSIRQNFFLSCFLCICNKIENSTWSLYIILWVCLLPKCLKFIWIRSTVEYIIRSTIFNKNFKIKMNKKEKCKEIWFELKTKLEIFNEKGEVNWCKKEILRIQFSFENLQFLNCHMIYRWQFQRLFEISRNFREITTNWKTTGCGRQKIIYLNFLAIHNLIF